MTTLEAMSQMDVWQAGPEYDGSTAVLPDPEPRERRRLIISVDDHLVEPPDLFTKRLAKKYLDRAPRVVEEEGREYWLIDGGLELNVGGNARGRRSIDAPLGGESVRFDEMRRGAWDIHERIRDMDINGIYASLGFPSMVFSFAGQRFMLRDPRSVSSASRPITTGSSTNGPRRTRRGTSRARSSGCSTPRSPPTRSAGTPSGLQGGELHGEPTEARPPVDPYRLLGPALPRPARRPRRCSTCTWLVVPGHASVDRRAGRHDYRALHGQLHGGVGRLGVLGYRRQVPRAEDRPLRGGDRLGAGGSRPARLPVRVPSDGHVARPVDLAGRHLAPEFLVRQLLGPVGLRAPHQIGIDHIMVEADYPHVDSTWPDTQAMIDRELQGLPAADVRKITCENAAQLYRHPLPDRLTCLLDRRRGETQPCGRAIS